MTRPHKGREPEAEAPASHANVKVANSHTFHKLGHWRWMATSLNNIFPFPSSNSNWWQSSVASNVCEDTVSNKKLALGPCASKPASGTAQGCFPSINSLRCSCRDITSVTPALRTSESPSADMTRNSRSTACADASTRPCGFLRSTYRCPAACVMQRAVGLWSNPRFVSTAERQRV